MSEEYKITYSDWRVTLFFDGGSVSGTAITEVAATRAALAQLPEGVKLTGRKSEKVPAALGG